MPNWFLVAKREYLERIRTKAFLVMTILIPGIMGGSLILPQLFVNRTARQTKHIVIVASDAGTAKAIGDELNHLRRQGSAQVATAQKQTPMAKHGFAGPQFTIDIDTNATPAERATLTRRVADKSLDAMLWATSDALAANKVSYITRDVSSFTENLQVEAAVSRAQRHELLRAKGLTPDDIAAAERRIDLDVQSPTGAAAGNLQATIFALVFLIMVLFISVLLYGVQVMLAVLEEKGSRVMEVLLASVSARDLMAGKIFGVGALGVTQIAIWTLAGAAFSAAGIAAAGPELKNIISLKVAVAFLVFFLLGYVIYSTMYAAVGAMCNSQQEAQQVQQIVTLPLLVPAFMLVYIIQYPGSTLSTVASMFPLTAPIVMFARVAIQTPPLWQIALSIGLQLLTIWGIILLASRIYRVGILMYGKRPTLPEIVRWIRYAY
jgi:ABC-2 type transport system permease protein